MSSYEIRRETGLKACVVTLSGDVDTAVVPDVREALDEVLGSGCSTVVLDLSGVTYADSSALGLLVWIDRRLRPMGGRLVLAGASRDVARILELSGLVGVAASISMSANAKAAIEGLELTELSTEPDWVRSIPVPIEIDRLAEVREQVSVLLRPLGFAESALFDLKVALGEALANALRHGAPADGGQPQVTVLVKSFCDRVVLEVADNGRGYNGIPPEGGDLYAASGRGVMFMRALTDRVDYESSESGGTLVRLTKHRMGAA